MSLFRPHVPRSYRTPPALTAKLTTGASQKSSLAQDSTGERAKRLLAAANAYLKVKRGRPQPSMTAVAREHGVLYATLHGVIKRGGVIAKRKRPTALSAVEEEQLRDLVRSALPQPSFRFPAEDRFYFKHEVVAEPAKKAAKASKRSCKLHLETGVSRRALSKCRQFFVSEQCVLPNPHRPGKTSTVGREFHIVSTYMRRKTLGTTPELAEPAGAPPQQQQQLAAASTSRERGAPAANKSRAAKQVHGAQDRALEQFFNKLEEDMAEVSMKRHGHAKQVVVFFGAATIGTGGGWGADAVLRACCKVMCRPRGAGQRRGRVVLVDEHRTSRVSSAVNGQQPCEEELDKLSATRPADWKPPAGQVEPRLVRPAWSQERGQPVRGLMWCPVVAPRKPPQAPRSSQAATQPAASEPGPSTPPPAKRSKPAAEPTKGKGKAAKAKPAPQPGRWLDRDCNAALNMQRIGESRWRPLELCYWPDQGALPAKGKEYPGLGYKRVRDKPPKAQEQQQQPAEAQ
ncbi:hypothetical protein QJQ45_011659 [Haematococcus lacustris]|nr:hypothetical protein QJQ45_011659 [Haematococcus lacustris]